MAKKLPTKKIADEQQLEQLSLRELTEVLIRHFGYRDGLYALSVEFKIATGQVGPSAADLLPGTIVGVSRVGLLKIEKPGHNTVDASEVSAVKAATVSKRTRKNVERG